MYLVRGRQWFEYSVGDPIKVNLDQGATVANSYKDPDHILAGNLLYVYKYTSNQMFIFLNPQKFVEAKNCKYLNQYLFSYVHILTGVS